MTAPRLIFLILALALIPPLSGSLQSEEKKRTSPAEKPVADKPAPKRSAPGHDASSPSRDEARPSARGEGRRDDSHPSRPVAPREAGPSPGESFLGVFTSGIAPPLREHLAIEEGFGVQILEVVADSPAEKAGMKSHDILLKVDDQRLISPEHLKLLVGSKKPGEKVQLTLIQRGGEKAVDATLGKTQDVAPREFLGMRAPRPMVLESRRLHPDAEKEDANRDDSAARPPGRRGRPPGPTFPRPQGRPPGISVDPGLPVSVHGTRGLVKIKNEHGEFTLTQKEGEDLYTIALRNAEGDLIHEGDYDPMKGTEGLPEKARDHLKRMKLDNLKVLAPRPLRGKPSPEKEQPAAPGRDSVPGESAEDELL